MAALSLANMLARVKRNVPTTTMDTELQDAILERMNYLVSIDVFPFQEVYQSTTLAASSYSIATPSNFASIKDITIWMGSDDQLSLEVLDSSTFSRLFPKPDENTTDRPKKCTVKVAEGEIWFNCPADIAYTVRLLFHAIPDDVTDTTVSQMVELAKLVLIKWASADGFRMMGEYDRGDQWEEEGNRFMLALKRRYQLSLEKDARFISPKEAHLLSKET